MSEFSIVKFLEIQSIQCSNYQISTILFDQEQNILYVGTHDGYIFVYKVMSQYVHIKLYSLCIQDCDYVQQIIKDKEGNIIILSLTYSKKHTQKQTYMLFQQNIDQLMKYYDTQQYVNQLFIPQLVKFKRLNFPVDFEDSDKYIERMYDATTWNLSVDNNLIQYIIEAYDGLYYMYQENDTLKYGCFLTQFTNFRIQTDQFKQKQDIYLSKSHIFIQIHKYLICLQFSDAKQKYQVLCSIKTEISVSDIFTSQYSIDFVESQLVYQADSNQIKVFIQQKQLQDHEFQDKTYQFEDVISFLDNYITKTFILNRSIDLYHYNNQIIKVQNNMFYTTNSVNILLGNNSKYYKTYYLQNDYKIDQVFGNYMIVIQHNYKQKKLSSESFERYLILVSGSWLYQTYNAFFNGFQTVNQNVIYYEREDEYDDEPDNEFYDKNFPLRSCERIYEQVKGLCGYETCSEIENYQLTEQELADFT